MEKTRTQTAGALMLSVGLVMTLGVSVGSHTSPAEAAEVAPASAVEGEIYALGWSSGELVTIDPTTAVATSVGTTTPLVAGSAGMYVDPVSADLIVPTWNESPFPVYRVNAIDATATEVLDAGAPVTGAATMATGVFIVYDGAGGSMLATMDSETGAYTDVASVTGAPDGISPRVSAILNCEGSLFAFLYETSDAIYSLNPATGQLTLVREETSLVDGSDIYAADCTAEGVVFATDSRNLLTSSSIATALNMVAPFSGDLSGTETMAIYVSAESLSGGGDSTAENAPELAATGAAEALALSTALGAAVLLLLGAGLLLSRRTLQRA